MKKSSIIRKKKLKSVLIENVINFDTGIIILQVKIKKIVPTIKLTKFVYVWLKKY